MQTIYYETSNFIRHEGNLVDLAAYRQKLAAVSGGNWSPAPEGSPAFEAEAPPRTGTVLRLVPEESPAQRAVDLIHQGEGAPAALGDGSAVPPWPWTSAPVRPSWS